MPKSCRLHCLKLKTLLCENLKAERTESSRPKRPDSVGVESLLVCFSTLRVQVPYNHILAQNLYYKYYYPKLKYLIIGYMDPLGMLPEPDR